MAARFPIVDPRGQPAEQVHAAVCGAHLHYAIEVAARGLEQRFLPLGVERSHTPDVPLEMSFDDEICHDGLCEYRRMHIGKEANLGERVEQRWWGDRVAEPERRKHDLAESSGVHHGLLRVEALQRRKRVIGVPQLAVVIVVQTERQMQAAIAYESTVLRALKDVEDALVALAQDQVARAHLTEAARTAEQASNLSLTLYTSGVRDFRDVLDAQRSLLSLQDQLASSTANVSIDMVKLYKALGGGWEP
jgi:hypothetical protein